MRPTWRASALFLALAACSDDDEPTSSFDASASVEDGGVTGDGGPSTDATVSDAGEPETFTVLYNDIMTVHGCPTCHVGSDHLSNLLFATRDAAYDGLVGKMAAGSECGESGQTRVVPGDADASLLIHKLEGEDESGEDVCGARMPFGLPPLSQSEINRVRAWIDDGAQDN